MQTRYGRRGVNQFRPGDKVDTTMGVKLSGTVATRHWRRDEWTDGTYRHPEPREAGEAVPVQWTDGTRGWIHARFLRPA